MVGINFKDIVEDNGKTIEQNNLEQKKHDIPIGTLVEVKYDEWFGNGACQKVHARLFVVGHNRDCDGTPLYSLSPNKNDNFEGAEIITDFDGKKWIIKEEIAKRILNKYVNGISREKLTPIEVTEKIKQGYDSLDWKDENGRK